MLTFNRFVPLIYTESIEWGLSKLGDYMCKFYLNKARKFLRLAKENKDGVFVNEKHQFVFKVELKSGVKLNIKLFPAYKPGGPMGEITKNPNKYVIDIREVK